MTTDTVEEIRAEHEARHGSQRGQYRLNHARVGVLLERIEQLESALQADRDERRRKYHGHIGDANKMVREHSSDVGQMVGAQPPSDAHSRLFLVPCPRCSGSGKLKPHRVKGADGEWGEWITHDCPEKHVGGPAAVHPTKYESNQEGWGLASTEEARCPLHVVHDPNCHACPPPPDSWDANGSPVETGDAHE